MSLALNEVPDVVKWMRDYPAGIRNFRWGYGPMDRPYPPEDFDEATRMEYG